MGLMADLFIPSAIERADKTRLTKLIIVKNFALICASMLIGLVPIDSLVAVQSTVNKEENLGLASSCVVYGVFGLSALMLPQLIISVIKLKWTYTLGLSLQLFYIGLNAYAKWYTYIPASALGGFGQALMFTCSSTAVQALCLDYAEVTQSEPNQSFFFGIFGLSLCLAQILGNLLIALVFGNFNKPSIQTMNTTFDYTTCGASFCPNSKLPPSAENDLTQVYILVGILGACAIISIVLSIMMNDIDYIPRKKGEKIAQIVKHQAKELSKQFFQLNQLLAIPVNSLNAFVLTFIFADFTRSYAACSAGIEFIGWASIVLYTVSSIFSPIVGKMSAKLSIHIVFYMFWVLIIGTCIWMLFWKSKPDSLYLLFILALVLGLIVSISMSLPRALYAMIFDTEAIYSSFTFFEGFGFLAGFLLSTFTCVSVKLYVFIGWTALSAVCCFIINLRSRRQKKYEINSAGKTSKTSEVEF